MTQPHQVTLRTFYLFAFTVFTLGSALVFAEDPIGGWEEKPGFALVKPQPWSQDSMSTVVEFQAFTDRTVRGGAVAGYYVLRTLKTPELQVPAARVVRMVVYPVSPSEIVRAEQRAALQKMIDENKALCAKFPSAALQLEKPLAALGADAGKFDSGKVKNAGKWIDKTAFYKKKADDLVALAKTEITDSKKVRDLNLSSSQYYIGLQEMAEAEPSLKSQLDGVLAFYQRLCRTEERNELMEKLKSGNMPLEESEHCVKRLKALKPEEDPTVNQYLESMVRNVDKAARLSVRIQELQAAFEREMATKTDATKPVVVSEDLAARTSQINIEINSIPQSLHPPVSLANAMDSCATALPEIQKEMDAQLYFDAKGSIVEIVSSSKLIGPFTAAAVSLLQKKTTSVLEKFEALRDEAKALKAGGKTKEAIAKYQEALAVVPDNDVTAQIDALNKK